MQDVSTPINQDCSQKTRVMGFFMLSSALGKVFLLIAAMFFNQSCSFITELCTSVPQYCIPNLVFQKVDVTLLFFTLCKLAKHPSWWTFMVLEAFCRTHRAGHVCQISSQSESWCEGRGLSKIVFLSINYSTTIWPIGRMPSCLSGNICTSLTVGP